MKPYEEIDLSSIKTYSAARRESKVTVDLEAVPPWPGMLMEEFLDTLPAILKAKDLKEIAKAVVNAKIKNTSIFFIFSFSSFN